MRPKVFAVGGVAAALAIALVAADSTYEWAIVGMIAAVLVVLAYDVWKR